MIQSVKYSLFFMLLGVSILAVCKKNDSPVAALKTYLVKETYGNVTIDYKYDDQNRFLGRVFKDPTNHQETFTTQFNSNGNPSEIILKDYTFGNTYKYSYTYDGLNRCTKIEFRDSVNPSTYPLRTTYDLIYTPNKITRSVTTASTGLSARVDFFTDANGNITKEDFYSFTGVHTTETTYTGYDDKKQPYNTTFPYIHQYINPTNNYTAISSKNIATSTVTPPNCNVHLQCRGLPYPNNMDNSHHICNLYL
jgi:hypothetical protein